MCENIACIPSYLCSHQRASSGKLSSYKISANDANTAGVFLAHLCWYYLLKFYDKTAQQRTPSGESTHMLVWA